MTPARHEDGDNDDQPFDVIESEDESTGESSERATATTQINEETLQMNHDSNPDVSSHAEDSHRVDYADSSSVNLVPPSPRPLSVSGRTFEREIATADIIRSPPWNKHLQNSEAKCDSAIRTNELPQRSFKPTVSPARLSLPPLLPPTSPFTTASISMNYSPSRKREITDGAADTRLAAKFSSMGAVLPAMSPHTEYDPPSFRNSPLAAIALPTCPPSAPFEAATSAVGDSVPRKVGIGETWSSLSGGNSMDMSLPIFAVVATPVEDDVKLNGDSSSNVGDIQPTVSKDRKILCLLIFAMVVITGLSVLLGMTLEAKNGPTKTSVQNLNAGGNNAPGGQKDQRSGGGIVPSSSPTIHVKPVRGHVVHPTPQLVTASPTQGGSVNMKPTLINGTSVHPTIPPRKPASTNLPSHSPTSLQTPIPSRQTTLLPSSSPTKSPAVTPTVTPTMAPTLKSSSKPNKLPTNGPTPVPQIGGLALYNLTTDYDGTTANKQGQMFNVQAINGIRIVAMDIHLATKDSGVAVEIYIRQGTFSGYQLQPTLWTKIGSSTVHGKGTGHPTHIPQGSFNQLSINAGETYGVYVTTTDTKYMMVTQKAVYDSAINDYRQFSNNDVVIINGSAVGYSFMSYQSVREFNGALYYE